MSQPQIPTSQFSSSLVTPNTTPPSSPSPSSSSSHSTLLEKAKDEINTFLFNQLLKFHNKEDQVLFFQYLGQIVGDLSGHIEGGRDEEGEVEMLGRLVEELGGKGKEENGEGKGGDEDGEEKVVERIPGLRRVY